MKVKHWSEQKERGSLLGLRFLFLLHRVFGKTALKIILYPIITYFFITGKVARQASKEYLANLRKHNSKIEKLSSFKHFMQFADAILDKLVAWGDDQSIEVEPVDLEEWEQIRKLDTGVIFVGAHLGNLDACRNQTVDIMGGRLNALMFTEHASNFIKLVKNIAPEFEHQIIDVETLGPETAILIQQKLEHKEHIFILADRIPPRQDEKFIEHEFLGRKAPFGTGAFVLAAIMKVPLYFISTLKQGNKYQLYLQRLETRLDVTRKERTVAIENAVKNYAKWLEKQCEKAPLQWYNFYPFWQNPNISNKNAEY